MGKILSCITACYRERLGKEEAISLHCSKLHFFTSTFSDHHPQSVAVDTEARPSTSKETATHWRLRWQLAHFSKEVYLNKGMYIAFLYYNKMVHLIAFVCSINRAFICTGEIQRFMWLILLWYLFNFSQWSRTEAAIFPRYASIFFCKYSSSTWKM